MAIARFKPRVGAVESWNEAGRATQSGTGCQDAEAATQPRHADSTTRAARRRPGVQHVFARERQASGSLEGRMRLTGW